MDWFTEYRDELEEGTITPRSKASREWFLGKLKSIGDGSVDRNAMLKSESLSPASKTIAGKMYMFWYLPKHRETLPYFDKFPLVLPLEITGQTLTALNLHYLPIDLRQSLFYSLLNRVNNNKYDESTVMQVTYETLKGSRAMKAHRPCIKKYLAGRIMGNIVNVPAQEWEIAVHLPTALWRKQNENYVHNRSREQIRNF
jgi:hypothetical protein